MDYYIIIEINWLFFEFLNLVKELLVILVMVVFGKRIVSIFDYMVGLYYFM